METRRRAARPVWAGRLAQGVGAIARGLGLTKGLAAPMSEFSDVFTGDEPWLSPGLPLHAKDEPGTPPRKFQYQPGYNIQITPRSTEPTTFAQLRALGDYTLVRVALERVKEALKAHEFDIVSEEAAQGGAHTEDILAAKRFFEKPDRRHCWDEWLGMLLEDLLVIDAPTIFRHRTRDGSLWALEIVDGATFKVLADERGFEPLAEDGETEPPAYQQFLYGVPKTWHPKSEIIYRPRNRRVNHFYGFSPVEQIIIVVNMGMRRELYNLAQFTDGNIPSAFGIMPPDWKPEEIKAWQEYWDKVLAGDPQNRSRIRWIPGRTSGNSVEKMQDSQVFGLANEFDEWIARVICFAFGLSPQGFVKMMNRATAQELGDQEAEYGLASVKLWVERLINEIIDYDLQMPHLRFNWVTDRGRMRKALVERNVAYVEKGIFQIDEVRVEEGLQPLGLPPGMWTPTGYMPFDQTPTPRPAQDAVMDSPDEVQEDVTPKAAAKCRQDELSAWERQAFRRYAKGEKAPAWKAEFIPFGEARQIALALDRVTTAEEIKSVFKAHKAKPYGAPVPRVLPAPKAVRVHRTDSGREVDMRKQTNDRIRELLSIEAEAIIDDSMGDDEE